MKRRFQRLARDYGVLFDIYGYQCGCDGLVEMSDFNFTKRGDHFQISSSESSRFILRLNTASSGDNVMIFGPFITFNENVNIFF